MKYINLTKGLSAMVDDEDFERVSKYQWRARQGRTTFYASHRLKEFDWKKDIHMHRLIVDAPKGMVVDHINRNGLDNRRANLRICSPGQNSYNNLRSGSSRFKGVYRVGNKWRARISDGKLGKHLGYYLSEEEAALAYNRAAQKAYGEYAYLNEVDL